MRDFAGAVQELDEVWRAIFNPGLIKPAARRQPGGVSIADVSLADADECEDEEADLAASTSAGRPFFTFAELRAQSVCLKCRGFGHVRSACTSSDGFRSIGHVLSILQAVCPIALAKAKGTGKEKGVGGRGSAGRGAGAVSGRSAAGRGKGAINVYLEDGIAYGTDGAFVVTVAGDDFEYEDEHEDEQAHTALLTSAACADSSSDDDGDGWMDQLGDAMHCLPC